jgi:glycosyltransferase involved in cell wall biosynthesis
MARRMDKPLISRRRSSRTTPAGSSAPDLTLAAPALGLGLAPAISVAICTYQRYDLLEGVLRAASAQAESFADFEILVVDNTPDPDRSLLEYRKHREVPRLRWVHEPQKGLSRARNRAVAESAAPIIAFLDDDAVPKAGWLRAAR